jgi:PAS domain S-box-containing protein
MPEIMFQELADNAPVMIWRAGPDKLCTWFNHLWLEFTGRTIEQEAGFGWAEGVHPGDLEACVARYNEAFDARQKFSMTYRLKRKDGVYRWLLDTGAPYSKGGVFSGYFGTCVDVSEQQEAHDIAVRALGERDALLREVYHRVKNNLQQIEGLIAIEGASVTDPEAREALTALSGRVRAMGAVHQKLISSGSMTELPLSDFITDLVTDLDRSLAADQRKIAVTAKVDAGTIHIERAVIVGLLINELVTNALKHAFPDGRKGHVAVRCVKLPSGLLLEVADDGVGMPASEVAAGSSKQSGMRLIRGFVKQLKGQLEIDTTAGTRATVKF